MTEHTPDLLPCPFCGGDAEIERLGTTRLSTIYQCTDCGCSLETGEEWGHGDGWNRRAPDLLAENTRLLTLLKDITQGDVIIGGSGRDASLLAENTRLGEVNAGLVAVLREARDLLLERTQGSPARSAAHNARLVIDAALRAAEEGA